MKFSHFIFRRALMVIPLLVGVLFLTFMLVRVGGLDPVGLLAGPTATAEEFEMSHPKLARTINAICVALSKAGI